MMSLIRSPDSSATSCGVSDINAHNSSSDSSGLSAQAFTTEEQLFRYGPGYNSSINSQQYYYSALTNVNPLNVNQGPMYHSGFPSTGHQLLGNARSSIIADNPCKSCFDAARYPDSSLSWDVSHHSSQTMPNNQSLEHDVDFSEDDIRLKLQQLEHTLLNDNDEELVGEDHNMGIQEDWSEPMKDLLVATSPNESSSESSIGYVGNKKEARTPKQLLFDCAALISEESIEEAQAMITELRQMVSIQGDPPQRIAAYLVEGLAARIASSGDGIYKALHCKEPPASDRLSAMQILFEICPCFKFGFLAANYAMIEAFKDEKKVHVIDFDINQGSQYITLLQKLSELEKPPHLRITGVDDPETVQRSVGGLEIIGMRLEELAGSLKVPFEFQAIAAKTADVTPLMLECHPEEALVVNFAFQLHHMPDESVSTVNQRDQLLRMVKSLRPKLVTLVEQDVNTNTSPFFARFVEVYNYYSAVFESLDATLSRGSADRMNVERQCLGRDIVNIIACEGTDRIERYEAAGKWRARMTMAGFASVHFNTEVSNGIQTELKTYCDRYKVKEENGAWYFGWEDKILVVASAWR